MSGTWCSTYSTQIFPLRVLCCCTSYTRKLRVLYISYQVLLLQWYYIYDIMCSNVAGQMLRAATPLWVEACLLILQFCGRTSWREWHYREINRPELGTAMKETSAHQQRLCLSSLHTLYTLRRVLLRGNIVKKDLWYTWKPLYLSLFTNNIWSY